MPNADRSIVATAFAVAAIALAACNRQQQPPEQNIVMDNPVDANAEIETLPPDESSATPSNQLANGEDNPDVSDLNASTNVD